MKGRPESSVSIPLICQFPATRLYQRCRSLRRVANGKIVGGIDHAGVRDVERARP